MARSTRKYHKVPQVEVLLSRWGRWAIRRESGALGFASSSILQHAGGGDAFDAPIPKGVSDGDMEAIDGAVNRLPGVLREVVIQVYQRGAGKSMVWNAARSGISRNALTEFLAMAHHRILVELEVS